MTYKTDASTVTSAYSVVSSKEEFEDSVVYAVELSKPSHTVSRAFHHIPEARSLAWEDDYFDDDIGDSNDDIVAVFDLDYEKMEGYYSSLGWLCFGGSLCFPNLFGVALLTGVPCFLNRNVRWNVRNQHVAVTRDGIRFVHDRRPSCWGYPCTDVGKRSKTIPFDKITDCDVVEPAGNTCLVVPNTLSSVHVDTASRASESSHELTLTGLKNPQGFKKLVWAMKRSYSPAVTAPPAATTLPAPEVGSGTSNEDVATLLRDIRDELRQNNTMLQSLKTGPVVRTGDTVQNI